MLLYRGSFGMRSSQCAFLLLQDYQRLLASQSVRRLNPAKVSESAALKTMLVDTIAFLESLAVKDSNEKDIFFKRLPATLPSLPLPVVQKKVNSLRVSVHMLISVKIGEGACSRTLVPRIGLLASAALAHVGQRTGVWGSTIAGIGSPAASWQDSGRWVICSPSGASAF